MVDDGTVLYLDHVVVTEIYTREKITLNHTHRQRSACKANEI